MISPLWEETRSTGDDVAGQHRILLKSLNSSRKRSEFTSTARDRSSGSAELNGNGNGNKQVIKHRIGTLPLG